MNFFDLLATFITIGIFVKGYIKHASFDNQNKNKAKNNKSITYMDSHGHEHLTSTGEKVCYTNGKIYSLKIPNQILYDPRQQYYEDMNHRAIEEAKQNNKKYVFLYYFYKDKVYCCKTELSTMKIYNTKCDAFEDWKYFKNYLEYDGLFKIKECIVVSKKEYEDLGGYVPKISSKEYLAQKTKPAKELTKILEG